MKNSLNLKLNNKTKNFLQRLANKSKKDLFPGVVIFANNGSSTNTQCAVYTDGAILNDTNPDRQLWSTNGGTWDTKGWRIVRHRPIGAKLMMDKGEVSKLMGINKLKANQHGFKAYPITPIGPVLYITVDTDVTFWASCIEAGMIDKKCKINLDKNFSEEMAMVNELIREVA